MRSTNLWWFTAWLELKSTHCVSPEGWGLQWIPGHCLQHPCPKPALGRAVCTARVDNCTHSFSQQCRFPETQQLRLPYPYPVICDQDWKLRRWLYQRCRRTWCSGQNEMGGSLEGSCNLLSSFCNVCFCQKQNTCFDWWTDQSFKRRLQAKRRLFVTGWKGPWLPYPLSTSLKGWSSPVPQLSEERSDCCPQRLSGAGIILPRSLIPQPISCYFKPFSIYHLPLLCPSHSHELVDTITAESFMFWLTPLNPYIRIFNFKLLWWPSSLTAWN